MVKPVAIYTADDQLENPRITYQPRPSSGNSASIDDDGSTDMEVFLAEQQDEVNAFKRVAGCQDISTLTILCMTVDTSELSISRIGQHMPSLVELKLNHSHILSVRDLGTGLKNLQVLWLSRVGLQRLDGVSAMPSLRELYVSFNHITTLEAVQGIERLEVLDLEGNCITDLKEIEILGLCSRLEDVALEGNPIALQPEYRTHVARMVPQLKLLDDRPVGDDTSGQAAMDMDEVQTEETLVSFAVRSARVGFDSHEFEEVEAAVAEGIEVRPGTAGLRVSLSSLRPSTTGRLAGRRGVTVSPASTRPSSAYRPQSATAHGRLPRPATTMSDGRPGAAKSLTSAGGLFWRKHRVDTASSVDDPIVAEEGSSDLTQGAGGAGLMGGGAAGALRRRREKPPSPWQGSSASATPVGGSLRNSIGDQALGLEHLLCELRAWKITATEVALKEQDVAKAPLISSSDEEEEPVFVSDDERNAGAKDLLTLGESASEDEALDQLAQKSTRPGTPPVSEAQAAMVSSNGNPNSGESTPRRSKHRVAVELARSFAAGTRHGLEGEASKSQADTLGALVTASADPATAMDGTGCWPPPRQLSRTSSALSGASAASGHSGLLSSEGSAEMFSSENGLWTHPLQPSNTSATSHPGNHNGTVRDQMVQPHAMGSPHLRTAEVDNIA
eukprot:CAMPEP_0117679758 /NCGR_PEP_ID=MMETSP0804-20121206/17982_1 /TAXON_ID=1074897 /ORGANISM="Tetraselmis astigmatica, Strain CCMP880" /LENGTH=671 /DNA_ID=CAMNT_0005489195 /DNA_START=489 /DNA_END=2504 /DNA_ORIENTATION=-